MITKKEVQHIAKLARLDLSEKEVEKHQKEFSKILNYIDKLKKVNLSKVNKTAYSSCNIMRKDEKSPASAKAFTGKEKLIKMAPETKDGYIKVPSILK